MPGQQPTAPAPPDVVRLVQILLNLFAGEDLRVDGVYGPATQQAVARAAAKIAVPLQKQL